MANNPTKPNVVYIFPLKKLQGIHPGKIPAVWVVNLEGDGTDKEEGAKSDNPKGIECMTEEFIVHLAKAAKEAQQDEKCCYHCSSLEHFIFECPLVKASRTSFILFNEAIWGKHSEEDTALYKTTATTV